MSIFHTLVSKFVFCRVWNCWCLLAKLCLTFSNPLNCTMPGFPVLHYVPEFAQTHVHWISDAIQPSHPLLSPSLPVLKSFPGSGSCPMSWRFTSGGQSIGASASSSALPVNIQGWHPLGLTGLILLSGLTLESLL